MADAAKEKESFSASCAALDEIIERYRGGSLDLEESLELFEQGVQHLKVCQTRLTAARGKVDELVKTLQTDGESVTRPFDA